MTGASSQLTSNVERGGRHLACPGQVVVLTCRGMGADLLNWATAANGELIQIPYGLCCNQEGDIKTVVPFTANLTKAVEEDSMKMLTSTLTFTFVDALNGITVECYTSVYGENAMKTALMEKNDGESDAVTSHGLNPDLLIFLHQQTLLLPPSLHWSVC